MSTTFFFFAPAKKKKEIKNKYKFASSPATYHFFMWLVNQLQKKRVSKKVRSPLVVVHLHILKVSIGCLKEGGSVNIGGAYTYIYRT